MNKSKLNLSFFPSMYKTKEHRKVVKRILIKIRGTKK